MLTSVFQRVGQDGDRFVSEASQRHPVLFIENLDNWTSRHVPGSELLSVAGLLNPVASPAAYLNSAFLHPVGVDDFVLGHEVIDDVPQINGATVV